MTASFKGQGRHWRQTEWTLAMDARLCALRRDGSTWPQVAADLGVSRSVCLERGKKFGLVDTRCVSEVGVTSAVEVVTTQVAPDRTALPPGHPTSWGRHHGRHVARG